MTSLTLSSLARPRPALLAVLVRDHIATLDLDRVALDPAELAIHVLHRCVETLRGLGKRRHTALLVHASPMIIGDLV